MRIEAIRKEVGQEVCDYVMLTSLLSSYKQPRDKIKHLLKSGELIRVKKGLYVFGKQTRQIPYSKEILANLIYGPSAISLIYALGFHGLIPERVEQITCITPLRNKLFDTPVGRFSYQHLHLKKYIIGLERRFISDKEPFLIASKEKALVDMLYFDSQSISSVNEMYDYLFDNLRIDKEILLESINRPLLNELAQQYRHPHVELLIKTLG
jgi:predicted transcriptional regulator of viral defense system